MLERMDTFFENRLSDYDEHMLTSIKGANEFYKFTAAALPLSEHCKVLDLGCGTGLELEQYVMLNPTAFITGIDLSQGMLSALKHKFSDKQLYLICASYFDVLFDSEYFNAAVSVESLHHFSAERKLFLYKNLYKALIKNGYFILTDYFAENKEQEQKYFKEFQQLKCKQGIIDDQFYHFDTPLTVEHEMQILNKAGFINVEILKNWGVTYTIKAIK